MSSQDTGGPAFPVSITGSSSPRDGVFGSEGMTLRDWFAGMALQGMLAGNEPRMKHIEGADDVYTMADAMLAARKRGSV